MVRCWTHNGKVLAVFAVCCILKLSVGSSTEKLNLTETGEIIKESKVPHNAVDVHQSIQNGKEYIAGSQRIHEARNSQSGSSINYDSQLINTMLQKSAASQYDQSQLIFDNTREHPKVRLKRTSSAIMLAAARRRLVEQRRKYDRQTVRKKTKAKKVGTAVRLAAARRRLQVGGRRQEPNGRDGKRKRQQQQENRVDREDTNMHETEQDGLDTEESGRQEEDSRRETEENRKQTENRRQTEESRRQLEESKRQSEERRRLLEEERRRTEERRRQLEERSRQTGIVTANTNKDSRNEDQRNQTDDERSTRQEEVARRRGQGQGQGHGQGENPVQTTAASRDRQDIRHRCTQCMVGDQTFPGHSRFEYVEDCTKHYCICRCDGTKDCPSTHTEDVCDDRDRQPERSVGTSCRACDAKGQVIEGGNFFDLQEDCTLSRDCVCFCNGTWACSPDKVETICVKTDQDAPTRHDNQHVNVNGCQQCHLEGRQYEGNSSFQLINVCIATTCRCSCTGAVECDPTSSVNICQAETTTTQGHYLEIVISRNKKKITEEHCQQCVVQGNSVEGNSKFNLKWSCFLDACFCDCQGRYSCVRQLGHNLCDLSTVLKEKPKLEKKCHGCFVEGRKYPGNSDFRYIQSCIARDCKCTCSGTLECDEGTAVNLCVTTDATVDPQSEVFVPGNGHGSKSDACIQCNINGSLVHGNSYFERRRGCYIEQCHCQCDGRLNCRRIPGQDQILCNETTVQVGSKDDQRLCRRCLFQGTDYPGNSTFLYTNGCAATNCRCTCSGQVDCDYTSTVNICEATVPSPSTIHTTTTLKPEGSDQCKVCTVDGKEFAGGANFELKRGCKAYPCQCSCNGRWGCDISAVKDVCSQDKDAEPSSQVSTSCRKCLHYGTEYDGDSRFQFTNSCVTINCKCDCNGNVECDYTSTVNNCVTRAPTQQTTTTTSTTAPRQTSTQSESEDGCKSCSVDGGDYKGNSDFELKRGCIVYPCQCHCSGRWGCRTDQAKDVCKEDTSHEHKHKEKCQKCSVEGKEYEGNSTFYHTHDCTQRTCVCTCSGAVKCNDETAVNICTVPPATSNPVGPPDHQGTCHSCNLQGKEYQGNSTFIYTDSCTAKHCTCTCTGAVECDDTTAFRICTTTTAQPETRTLRANRKKDRCQKCFIEGQSYSGGSKFKLKRGCLAYPCHCDCSGRWWCDRENVRDICIDGEEDEDTHTSCSRCDVEGRRFPGDSEFRLRKGCISFKCKCSCDGTWDCPPELASNYCPGSTESTSPATQTVPITRDPS